MIKVWGRRNSMNVQKVMWTLGELGLEYERFDVAGSFGVDEAYLQMNPNGVVPTIGDGDLRLYESNACVRYLSRQYGEGTLCPSDAAQAAIADQWMDWQCSTFGPAFFTIFINRIRVPVDKINQAQLDRGIKQTGKLCQQLDTLLTQQPFLAGQQLTMADIPLGAMLYRYFNMDISRPALSGLEQYYDRLCSRQAYQRHVMIPFGSNVEQWLIEEQKNAGVQ